MSITPGLLEFRECSKILTYMYVQRRIDSVLSDRKLQLQFESPGVSMT